MLNGEEILEKINSEISDKVDEVRIDPEYRISIFIKNEFLLDVANYLKHELGFVYPNMCTGTDNKDHIEVFWHVGPSAGPILVILRVKADRDKPVVQSLTNIWKGFNWHERETYDMLGVKFNEHPDLRRLIMPDNWEGHPLLEDYMYKKPYYRKLEDDD